MANNYLLFSEVLTDITPDQKIWLEKFLAPPPDSVFDDDAAIAKWAQEHGCLPDEAGYYPTFRYSFEPSGANCSLWMYSEESANLEEVAALVHVFFREFAIDKVWTLTYSETCSKPRVGEFSGGWVVVSKNEIIQGNAYSEAKQIARALKTGGFQGMTDLADEYGALYATMTPREQHLFSLLELVFDMLEEGNTKPECIRMFITKAIEPERLRCIQGEEK